MTTFSPRGLLELLDSSVSERVAAEQAYMWQVAEGSIAMLALEEATTRKELSQQMRHEGRLLELVSTAPSQPARSTSSSPPPVTRSPLSSQNPRADSSNLSVKELEALWALEKATMQRKINELRTRIATIELGSAAN